MSYKNPTTTEIKGVVKDPFDMKQYFHKSYLNLAKTAFYHAHNKRNATLDDAQELFDHFVFQWRHWYKGHLKLKSAHKRVETPLWDWACARSIDVKASTLAFIQMYNPKFHMCYDDFYGSWIIRKGMFEEYKKFALGNKKKFKYYGPSYVDYSHLAYNGITESF